MVNSINTHLRLKIPPAQLDFLLEFTTTNLSVKYIIILYIW